MPLSRAPGGYDTPLSLLACVGAFPSLAGMYLPLAQLCCQLCFQGLGEDIICVPTCGRFILGLRPASLDAPHCVLREVTLLDRRFYGNLPQVRSAAR